MAGLNTAWMTKPINNLDDMGWGRIGFLSLVFSPILPKIKKAEINLL